MTSQDRSLTREQVEALAEHIESAELNRQDITKVTNDYPTMTMEDAYEVQWEIRRRKEARGAKIVGMKMGLTSRAKMEQMGVDTPIYGFLADYFDCSGSADIELSSLIHPKVEAEIAFITKDALRGPGCHIGSVMAATEFIVPAVEIIDSRYRDFNFDLISVIADNASSSRFVIGTPEPVSGDLNLRTLGVVMAINGDVVELGAGAAVLGHPAASIAVLANMLAERGEEIPAGSLILSGAITAAVSVKSGDVVTLRSQGLSDLSMKFI